MEKNNKMSLEEAAKDFLFVITKEVLYSDKKDGSDIMNLKDLMQTPEFKHFEQAVNPEPTTGDFIKWIEHFTHKSWVEEDQKIAKHLLAYLEKPPKLRNLMWFENTGKMPTGYNKALVKYKDGSYGVVNVAEANWDLSNPIASIERFLIIE